MVLGSLVAKQGFGEKPGTIGVDGNFEGASTQEAMLRKSQVFQGLVKGMKGRKERWCWGLELEHLRGWQCPRQPRRQQEESPLEGRMGRLILKGWQDEVQSTVNQEGGEVRVQVKGQGCT